MASGYIRNQKNFADIEQIAAESDEKLTSLIEQRKDSFDEALNHFHKIITNLERTSKAFDQCKATIAESVDCIGSKNKEEDLIKHRLRYVEKKTTKEMLENILKVKNATSKSDHYLATGQYKHLSESLSQSLRITKELKNVKGVIEDLRDNLNKRKSTLKLNLLHEIRHNLYQPSDWVKKTDFTNMPQFPIQETVEALEVPLTRMGLLIESLATLEVLSEVLKELSLTAKENIKLVIQNACLRVSDWQQKYSPQSEMPELLVLVLLIVFQQFKIILKAHKIFLHLVNDLITQLPGLFVMDVKPYTLEMIWGTMVQCLTEDVVYEYVAYIVNLDSQSSDHNSQINSFFQDPRNESFNRKEQLFSFSHHKAFEEGFSLLKAKHIDQLSKGAFQFNSVLSEDDSAYADFSNGEIPLVCPRDTLNIVQLYQPLVAFLTSIEESDFRDKESSKQQLIQHLDTIVRTQFFPRREEITLARVTAQAKSAGAAQTHGGGISRAMKNLAKNESFFQQSFVSNTQLPIQNAISEIKDELVSTHLLLLRLPVLHTELVTLISKCLQECVANAKSQLADLRADNNSPYYTAKQWMFGEVSHFNPVSVGARDKSAWGLLTHWTKDVPNPDANPPPHLSKALLFESEVILRKADRPFQSVLANADRCRAIIQYFCQLDDLLHASNNTILAQLKHPRKLFHSPTNRNVILGPFVESGKLAEITEQILSNQMPEFDSEERSFRIGDLLTDWLIANEFPASHSQAPVDSVPGSATNPVSELERSIGELDSISTRLLLFIRLNVRLIGFDHAGRISKELDPQNQNLAPGSTSFSDATPGIHTIHDIFNRTVTQHNLATDPGQRKAAAKVLTLIFHGFGSFLTETCIEIVTQRCLEKNRGSEGACVLDKSFLRRLIDRFSSDFPSTDHVNLVHGSCSFRIDADRVLKIFEHHTKLSPDEWLKDLAEVRATMLRKGATVGTRIGRDNYSKSQYSKMIHIYQHIHRDCSADKRKEWLEALDALTKAPSQNETQSVPASRRRSKMPTSPKK